MTRLEMMEKVTLFMEQSRDELGLSQAQMASKLDLSLSGYRKLLRGEVLKIDLYMLYKLYKLTGKWAFGIIDMEVQEAALISMYNRLSDAQKSFVRAVMEFEADFKPDEGSSDDYVSVIVPTGNIADGMVYDSSNLERVNVAPYRRRFGSRLTCGIKIISNHLHPVYHQGDILLVCCEPIRDGDTGVFINKDNGCAYIRKFSRTEPCRLEPVNNYGVTFTVDSNDPEDMAKWIKFGYVLTKIR